MRTALIFGLAQRILVAAAAYIPSTFTMNSAHVRFEQLPLNEGDPPYSAWGLFGEDDELGRINLITPEVTKRASKEIKTGEAVSLK
jgi:hypothetical protein